MVNTQNMIAALECCLLKKEQASALSEMLKSEIPLCGRWDSSARLKWCQWYIEKGYAAGLFEDGRIMGIAMGRPATSLQLVSTDWYYNDPAGEYLWVDAVVARSGKEACILWEFAQEVLGAKPYVAFFREKHQNSSHYRAYRSDDFQVQLQRHAQQRQKGRNEFDFRR